MVRSMKWRAVANGINSLVPLSAAHTYNTKAAKSMTYNTSQLCGSLYLVVCLSGEMEPFKDHPNTRKHLTNLRIKPQ